MLALCPPWLKTSGGNGLHVVVPLAPVLDYDTVKEFSKTFVQHLVRTIPERFTAVPVYDALYAWCQSCQVETHNWPPKMS